MPANFPEVWLKRVIKHLSSEANAPFLAGIPEMSTPVIESGTGSASETNEVHVPATAFEVDVLINNTTYPIALQSYTDSTITIKLDKFQTKVTTLSDDEIIGAAYQKIDVVTAKHVEAILKKKFGKAIHAIAPAADTPDTPVLETTGTPNAAGRRILVYDDIVTLKDRLDKADMPQEGRRLVPCSDHWNDMLLDRKNFGDQIVNYNTGKPAPVIAGFEIYPFYLGNPHYNGTNKLAYGAVPGASDYKASVVFAKGNIAKKSGMTKQYFAKAKTDPENQTNKLNYRHYYISIPFENKHLGAIVSAQ